jgi:inorganic pyrophosphatase
MTDELHVVIEIPRGSRNEYEWDEELQAIKLDRFLFSSMVYPPDYGFFPASLAEDGDPLDAMVCVDKPTFPGCVIVVRAVALFGMSDEKGPDDKVLCVPSDDPNWNHVNCLEDLPQQLRDEIAHFFSVYKEPDGHDVTVEGWCPREDALAIIEASRHRHRDRRA